MHIATITTFTFLCLGFALASSSNTFILKKSESEPLVHVMDSKRTEPVDLRHKVLDRVKSLATVSEAHAAIQRMPPKRTRPLRNWGNSSQ